MDRYSLLFVFILFKYLIEKHIKDEFKSLYLYVFICFNISSEESERSNSVNIKSKAGEYQGIFKNYSLAYNYVAAMLLNNIPVYSKPQSINFSENKEQSRNTD